jgi:hypothetical protein
VEARAEPHPTGTEIAATAALSLARERFARKAGVGISAAPSSSSLVPCAQKQASAAGRENDR